MTDDQLSTLVREHVTHDEPRFGLDAETVLRAGRSRVRRRRLVAGTGVTAVVAVLATVLAYGGGGNQGPDVDPASPTYDATQMPEHLQQAVRDAVPADLVLPEPTLHVIDGGGNAVPAEYYDKASAFGISYVLGDRDVLTLDTYHAKSEAEGAPDGFCRELLADHTARTCTVSRDAEGHPVLTWTWAVARDAGGWLVKRPDEVTDGMALHFERNVKVIRSTTQVSSARERVAADTLAQAEARWTVPVTDLARMAADPGLTFPRPPKDPENGCDWVIPAKRASISCGATAPSVPETP